ncbi:MAG: NACHT domain-containing protein [Candidatus Promineifilaceae bacterium]
MLPPDTQSSIAAAAAWLWDKYCHEIVEKTAEEVVDEEKWRLGIESYLESLYEQVGFVRILGRMESEPLERVFTHVNLLDRLTAERRYSIERLEEEFAPRDFEAQKQVKRMAGDTAVDQYSKLFILGEPGAGKTTFLKYIALRAIKREIDKIPVFVNLRELSDSNLDIFAFIERQFEVQRISNPAKFVSDLLKDGNAIVLFDGLDEVNLEDNRRGRLIADLNDFIRQCGRCPIFISSRVAAVDYSFTQFQYVEMAEFDEEQIGCYIDQWFYHDEVKRQNCRQALLGEENNKPVREMAQAPMLLSLLCLVYDERNAFPPQRHEIYEETVQTLLSKWDNSRNIVRDAIYPLLSLKQKENLLAFIAARTFPEGEYFIPEHRVVALIKEYIQEVPEIGEPDAEQLLKVMEAQHGIFVERARRIHSFSHLSLQEYFTARYIVANERHNTVERLMPNLGDSRWDEVFVLTAGMLDDATEYCYLLLGTTAAILAADPRLVLLLKWAEDNRRRLLSSHHAPAARAFLLYIGLALAYERNHTRDLDLDLARELTRDLMVEFDLPRAIALTRTLDHDFAQDFSFIFSPEQAALWTRYLKANRLLVRCLEVASLLDREAFVSRMLLPLEHPINPPIPFPHH